jgi:hypothetical protein
MRLPVRAGDALRSGTAVAGVPWANDLMTWAPGCTGGTWLPERNARATTHIGRVLVSDLPALIGAGEISSGTTLAALLYASPASSL